MAASTLEALLISVTEYDISEIPTASSTFSTMPDPMVTLVTSSEVRQLLHFKMADRGPELPIFRGHFEFMVEFGLLSISVKRTCLKYRGIRWNHVFIWYISEIITTYGARHIESLAPAIAGDCL